MNIPKSDNCYQFGEYRLDITERTILRATEPVSLSPKSFDVLSILVQNGGRLLAKDYLLAAVWPGVTVEENSLAKAVAEIRKALGEGPRENRYVVTVARRGYRFIPTVTGWSTVRQENAPVVQIGSPLERPDREVTRLAVLPFTWLTTEGSDGPLSVGIADALITRLSSLPQLIVRPTTSIVRYQSDERGAAEIGVELGTDYVISGSLQQVSDKVRVTVQMVDLQDSRLTWADHFEETAVHIFAVEDSISEKIAAALALKFTQDRQSSLRHQSTRNNQAWQYYLRGRYFLSKRTFSSAQSAIDCFRRALAADSGYTYSWVGLADAYILIGLHGALTGWLPPRDTYPQAKHAALEALRIDDASAEAHASLGFIRFFYDWDPQAAQQEFSRSFSLHAHYVNAHHWYAMVCAFLGQERDAVLAIDRALQIEPLSSLLNANKGYVYYFARKYDDAIAQLQLTLEIDSSFAPTHHRLGLSYGALGRERDAVRHFEEALLLSDDSPQVLGALGHLYGRAGDKATAQKMLERLVEKSHMGYVSAATFAEVYIGLGQYTEAFKLLEQALNERTSALVRIGVDPRFDCVRSDARFQALIRRVHISK